MGNESEIQEKTESSRLFNQMIEVKISNQIIEGKISNRPNNKLLLIQPKCLKADMCSNCELTKRKPEN